MKKLYYSIKEVAEMLNVNQSLLRYWEKEFSQFLKIKRNKHNVRQYQQKDIETLKLIHYYVKDLRLTLNGAKEMLKKSSNTKVRAEIIDNLKQVREELVSILEKL